MQSGDSYTAGQTSLCSTAELCILRESAVCVSHWNPVSLLVVAFYIHNFFCKYVNYLNKICTVFY
jgi:hypothetical protein